MDLNNDLKHKVTSQWYLVWLRYKRNRGSLLGLFLLIVILTLTVFGPIFYRVDPDKADLRNVLSPPSKMNLLGTDEIGRDILSRLFHGGRISILLGILTVSLAMVIGTSLGIVSGFLGGRFDQMMVQVADIMMAFPAFLLALLTISILGPGLLQAMIAIGLSEAPRFFRLTRASTLSVKEMEYVYASYCIGRRPLGIMFRHILPNIMTPIIVQSTLLVGIAILWAASLGFLGLGVQPPTSEWGNMLSNARSYMRIAPHTIISPGLAIMLTVLSFNLTGDGLRDVVDVRISM